MRLMVRGRQRRRGCEKRLLRVHRTRSALRELLDAAVEKRPPSDSALSEVNRALRAPYVYRARSRRGRCVARPSPRGRPDQRRHGAPVRSDRARADPGRQGTAARLRQRRVPLGVQRQLAGRPAQVVRHVQLRQPRQGRAPPRAPEAEGRSATRLPARLAAHCEAVPWTKRRSHGHRPTAVAVCLLRVRPILVLRSS